MPLDVDERLLPYDDPAVGAERERGGVRAAEHVEQPDRLAVDGAQRGVGGAVARGAGHPRLRAVRQPQVPASAGRSCASAAPSSYFFMIRVDRPSTASATARRSVSYVSSSADEPSASFQPRL